MPDHTSLTYRQLYKKLTDLGFEEYGVELDGKRGRVFEHPAIAGSMIVLPERTGNEPVERFYLVPVLAMLREHHLLPESDPLSTCPPLR